MPLITTHHQAMFGNLREDGPETRFMDISEITPFLIDQVLKESPGLVADVARGAAESSALESVFTKNLDKCGFYCGLSRDEMIRYVFDGLFGYGSLQRYVEDEDISDIDGTRYNEFAAKKNGKRYRIPVNFNSEKAFETFCRIIAIRNGGILNENDSHCRITDEKYRLRINLSIKPRNLAGPAISIRKHRHASYSMDDLHRIGMLDARSSALLKGFASTDATVVFCGKGAAGKTTLLRAFVNCLPEMERILIAETDAEIFPDKPYCIEQRIKKANEGGRQVTLRDLVKDGLTMSLDTYCIGEITGDEAWEFIKAAFSGHRGLATTHSGSAEDSLSRLLTLSKDADIGESESTIKEMMAESIDIVVFLKDFRVERIIAIKGYERKSGNYLFENLYESKP